MKSLEVPPQSQYFIPITKFDVCAVDNKNKSEIAKLFPSRRGGAYYLDKFINYLKQYHNLSMVEYCEKFLCFSWPKCPKRMTKNGFIISGRGIHISTYSKGGINKANCKNFLDKCEEMSKLRKGSSNPMYGKTPWNKDLPPYHPYIIASVERKTGTKASEETKNKQRERRKESIKKARHTQKHSSETVLKLREHTAKMWQDGRYNKTTSIHIKMRECLNTLSLNASFEEEFKVDYFSLDFAFPSVKLGIECQGTYYHIDPRKYPNGPINAMQRRNFGRDRAKKTYLCSQRGWQILALWETEINNGEFKKILLCKLKELNLLKK